MSNNGQVMVSVRCYAYNHSKYIQQCLESILMQKTNFLFEIIVHDDASTDNTATIIKGYEEKYPNLIKAIYEKDNQYSKHDGTIKRIMDTHTHGKYIAICEGDDYWIDPLKLQKQFDFMEDHKDYSLCGTNGLILWDNGVSDPKYFNDIFKSKELLSTDIIGHWYLPTASLFYRKDVIFNYPDWSKKIYSGDQTLILISLYLGRIYCLSDITCIYRKSFDNKVSISNNVDLIYMWNQHKLLYNYFNNWSKKKYNNIIMAHIDKLNYNIKFKRKEDKYKKIKNKFCLLPFLVMPFFSLKKILASLHRRLKFTFR